MMRSLLGRDWAARRGALARRLGAPGRQLSPRDSLRRRLFERVLRDVEREGFAGLEEPAARSRVRRLMDESLAGAGQDAVTPRERDRLEIELVAELRGFGPLEPLMADPTVSDVLVNGPCEVWVDRFGRLERTGLCFDDEAHVMRILARIVAAQGRHLEEAMPYVDTRLADGSRLHAMLPPLSPTGVVIAIRRPRTVPFRMSQLEECGTLSPAMGRFLEAAIRAGLNILVSGGAAAGKTTLLNVLSQSIPPSERVVTIEETAELRFEHPHVVVLETRMANIEGRGEVTLRTLVRNALRMRADRIIVGEVRSAEVFDMLQAMNLGHNGSLTTVHANGCEDALRRIETLVVMGGAELPARAIRELIGSAFHVIVHMVRQPDGMRRVAEICEVVGRGDAVAVEPLFGLGADGRHRPSGHRPAFLARLKVVAPDVDTVFGTPAPESGQQGDPA